MSVFDLEALYDENFTHYEVTDTDPCHKPVGMRLNQGNCSNSPLSQIAVQTIGQCLVQFLHNNMF